MKAKSLFLGLALAAAAVAAPLGSAFAQAWPSKPVKILFGFPTASATDVVARAVGQKLSGEIGGNRGNRGQSKIMKIGVRVKLS